MQQQLMREKVKFKKLLSKLNISMATYNQLMFKARLELEQIGDLNRFSDYRYDYDKNGNLCAIYENNKIIKKLYYDKKNRLIREDIPCADTTLTFKYNNLNQVIQKVNYPYSSTNNLVNGECINFEYANNKLVKYDDAILKYDRYNYPIVYRSEKFCWKNHQLKGIGKFANFSYNNGVRTNKNFSGDNTKFYTHDNKIIAQVNNEIVLFIYKNNEICGFTLICNNSIMNFFYKKNMQGDIIGIYNSEYGLICKYVYDTWGNHKIYIQHNNTFVDINYSKNCDSYFIYVAETNPYRFHGEYFDVESGLYYIEKDYYDPEIGRYIILH